MENTIRTARNKNRWNTLSFICTKKERKKKKIQFTKFKSSKIKIKLNFKNKKEKRRIKGSPIHKTNQTFIKDNEGRILKPLKLLVDKEGSELANLGELG